MGYMKIANLYREQRILSFKEVYVLEKVHGTSTSIRWDGEKVSFFSGGESHEKFCNIFDANALSEAFKNLGHTTPIVVFGEGYGGKQQGMSASYGKDLCFIVFDVKIGDSWLDVPAAERVAGTLGLEFVPYEKGPTELAWIDAQRDADSIVAMRRGMGPGHIREGVVLRPPFEVTLNNGERCMSKHKRDEFRETKSPRPVDDPAKLEVLNKAQEIADEWVTVHRLEHILQKIPTPHGMEQTKDIVAAMVQDVIVEGAGEIVDSKDARKAIGAKTVALLKSYLKKSLVEKG